jgi:hypothetical protein
MNWEVKTLSEIKAENIVINRMSEYYDAIAKLSQTKEEKK